MNWMLGVLLAVLGAGLVAILGFLLFCGLEWGFSTVEFAGRGTVVASRYQPEENYMTFRPVMIGKVTHMMPQHHRTAEHWELEVEIRDERFDATAWRKVEIGDSIGVWRRSRWTGENLEIQE